MGRLAEFDDLAVQADALGSRESDVMDRLADSGLDLAAMALTSNVFRVATAMRRRLEQAALQDDDLSWTAFKVLWVLWIWGEQEMRLLAVEADVTKGTLTGVVNTLEHRGLVERRRHADDRRLVSVALTGAGTTRIEAVMPIFNAEERAIADLLHPADQHAMISSLRRLVSALQDREEPA